MLTGFNVVRNVSTFRASTNDETTSTGRLYNNRTSFSSGPSSYSRPMPRIAEVENESLRVSGPENGRLGNGNGSNGHFIPNFRTDSWNNASISGLKRARESDGDLFCGLSRLQTQVASNFNSLLDFLHSANNVCLTTNIIKF